MRNKGTKPTKLPVNKPLALVSKTDVESFEKMYPTAWYMTSRDFHTDPDARLDFMMSRVKDRETLTSFQRAICYNRHLFIGRRVLVLNCGVDFLLTLWALKNGAAHVYGVDTSHAIEYLRTIICNNNLRDNITLMQGRVQDIELPVEEVDIIISNWMGYSLLINSKCEALIYARDKWLKKDTGVIFPDEAQLYVVGIENSKNKNQHVDWWRDVNGFNMNAIRNRALREPIYQTVKDEEILTGPVKVWSIDLYKITTKELHFRTPFTVNINRCGCLEGVLTFFDVNFSKSHTPMGFSTSPWSPHTSWLQTVFYFNNPVSVNVGKKLYCGIKMRPLTYKNKSTSYSVIMEVYEGIPDSLSQVANMTWYRKSENSMTTEHAKPFIVLEMPRKIDNGIQDTNKTKLNEPAKPLTIKQSKPKPAEKKRRSTKKIDASLFFK